MVLEGFGRVWKGWEGVGRGGWAPTTPKNPSVRPPSVRPSVRRPSAVRPPSVRRPSVRRPSVRRPSAVRPSAVRPSVRPSVLLPLWMGVCDPTTPKPRQIVRCLGILTHARSYLRHVGTSFYREFDYSLVASEFVRKTLQMSYASQTQAYPTCSCKSGVSYAYPKRSLVHVSTF